jgi:RNA polymerase primary sigma factor
MPIPDLQDAHLFRHDVLPRAELNALLVKYRRIADRHGAQSRAAIAVRNSIVTSNMLLVAHVAKRYRAPRSMDPADVRAFGVAGLIHAVETFDPSRGCQFSTHALWQIRHSIGRALADLAHLVRIPIHLQAKNTTAKPELQVAAAQARDVWSLNAPINSDEGPRTLGDVVEDAELVDAGAAMAADQDAERLRRAIAKLPERLRAVVELRYLGEGTRTLLEVGDAMGGWSRERIRQLEVEAFNIMRKELGAS